MALTPKMKLAIELLTINPLMPKKEVAVQCGVTQQAVSKWMGNPEFRAEWDRKIDQQWSDGLKRAKQRTLELMESDNPAVALGATKLLMAKQLADKTSVDINGDISIEVTINAEDKS